MDRGTFAAYGTFETDDLTVNALRHLFLVPVEVQPIDDATRSRLSEAAQRLAGELTGRVGRGAGLRPDDIPPGVALDHIGPDSGHTLFLLDTPFSQRSSPPTDLNLTRTVYVVTKPLPASTSVAPVVPWFGQPGGGIMVSLDHPIRWCYDAGYLDVVSTRVS
jgi:hypothetical protein